MMNGEGTMPTMNRRRGLALLVPSLLFLLTGLVLSSASSASGNGFEIVEQRVNWLVS